MFSRRQISNSTCSLQRKTDFGFVKTVWRLCALILVASTGCCLPKPDCQLARGESSSSVSECPSTPAETSVPVTLPQIDFSERTAIALPVTMKNIMGWPLNSQLAPYEGLLGELSEALCHSIAFVGSPAGNEIDKHRDWLARNGAGSPTLFEAMSQQALYERGSHTARTLDLFFNLANLYSQQPTLKNSQTLLEDTQQAIEKLRAAGIPVKMDVTEFDRNNLEVVEQQTIMLKQQLQLTAGLRQLLNLQTESIPIWTVTSHVSVTEEFGRDPESDYATALMQRGDLRAIELLANDPASVTSEQLSLLATSGTPLLNAKLLRPKVAQWWQLRARVRIKRQLEAITREETNRRRTQLMDLAESKRQQIRKEIFEATVALNNNRRLLELKQERLASLQQSILAAERAKDDLPLDAEQHVAKLIEANKLESEIINQQFAIAIDANHLKQARGDYAFEARDSMICR